MKTICFFGIYDPGYARNRVLMQGFKENGWRVIECRADPRRFRGLRKYLELIRGWRRVRGEPIDLVMVAFPGHTVMPLARLLWGRHTVFDAFLSLYDSNVHDRKVHAPGSVAARLDWVWDWLACRLAAHVLLDTEAHITYFVETFKLPRAKFIRAWIGADSRIFSPRHAAPPATFTVHFHGTFIPLQGIEYILDAAHELRDEGIRFRIVGSGQESTAVAAKAAALALTNVEFVGLVPFEEIPTLITAAHVALGIFGNTAKTTRVIPNKVFEQLAMGAAVITADTPAVRELEAYGELPMLLVPPADGAALAAAIRTLKADPARRAHLANAAAAFSRAHLSEAVIVRDLLAALKGQRIQ